MIKIFAEFHGGRRCPNISYKLNDLNIVPSSIMTIEQTPTLRRMIVDLDCQIRQGHNRLCLLQEDKTDSDLIMQDTGMIDHYVEIRDIQINGVHLESVLFQANPVFKHSMSSDWVQMMHQRGFDIPEIYERTTQLRLNGEWRLDFQDPVWIWHAETLLA